LNRVSERIPKGSMSGRDFSLQFRLNVDEHNADIGYSSLKKATVCTVYFQFIDDEF
jgi:hypothetical protein